jgi:putative ABC transport system permease protein
VRGGRGFSAEEAARPGTAALVNEALATRLWPGVNPVGRGIRVENGRFEVIGVVADYLHAPVSKVIPAVFMPLPPYAPQLTRVRFVMRAPVAEGPLIAALRRDIRRIGSGHVLATAFTVDDTIAVAGQEILFGTLPLVPLVIIGMLLTASGVYAVLAFALARRSKEFALRIAIGASDSHLIRLVAEHSLWLIGVGSVLGVMFTFALSRVVRASGGAGSMFDTPAWPAFIVPTLIIALVGTIATWIPSRRALRTEPAVLLRVD